MSHRQGEIMTREIDVTVTVEYEYYPADFDHNAPAEMIIDFHGVKRQIYDAAWEDVRRELEVDDPPRREWMQGGQDG